MTRLATCAVVRVLVVLAAVAGFQRHATAQTVVEYSVASGPQSPPSARPKIDVSKLGPQVGDRVPDFSLKDQHGKTWTRQSIMGPKGAMLVLIRSAEW